MDHERCCLRESFENKRKKVKRESDPSSGPAWWCQLHSCSSPWWCRQDSWHGYPEWWRGILLPPPAVLAHHENVKKQRIEEKKGQAERCIDVLAPLQDDSADGPPVQWFPFQGFSSAPKQTNRILFKPKLNFTFSALPVSESRNEQIRGLKNKMDQFQSSQECPKECGLQSSCWFFF